MSESHWITCTNCKLQYSMYKGHKCSYVSDFKVVWNPELQMMDFEGTTAIPNIPPVQIKSELDIELSGDVLNWLHEQRETTGWTFGQIIDFHLRKIM